MTVYIANVNLNTDTFGQWVEKTNYIIQAMANVAVTVGSNAAVGDAKITGKLTANNLLIPGEFITVGNGTSNSIISNSAFVLQTSVSTNNVITPTGMLIDGVTQYTKTFMTIGNTVINGAGVTANSITIDDHFAIGNTRIDKTSTVTNVANSDNLNVSNTAFIGDVEANVVIDRDGISISSNPSGFLVVNSYITSTDLWIERIHTKSVEILDAVANTVFNGNVFFYGANNYFAYGLTANGRVSFIGNTVTFNSNTLFNGSNNVFGVASIDRLNGNVAFFSNVTTHTIKSDRIVLTSESVGPVYGNTILLAAPWTTGIDWDGYTFTFPSNHGEDKMVFTSDGAGGSNWLRAWEAIYNQQVQLNNLGVGVAASGVQGEIRATGNITAFYSSDKRLKENIANITDALAKLQSINGVEFDWTDDYIAKHGGLDDTFMRKHDVGVIAQEVEAIMPEVVVERPDGYKAVKYDKIIALLIEAIKELKAEVDSLKNGN